MHNRETPEQLAERAINRDALYGLVLEERFLRFPDEDSERNQLIAEEYGDAARFMSIQTNNHIVGKDGEIGFESGIHYTRAVIQSVMQSPDDWVPMLLMESIVGYPPSAAIRAINDHFEQPVIDIYKTRGMAYYRLMPDVMLLDPRDHDTYQKTDLPIKHTRRRHPEVPTFESKLIFDDPDLENPSRYPIVLNSHDANAETEQYTAFLAKKRQGGPSPRPNRLVYFDDTYAEINKRPIEAGPFATQLFHDLLRRYLTLEKLDVLKLAPLTDDYKQQVVQRFMQSLVLRNIITVETRPVNGQMVIGSARLNPIIIEDKRLLIGATVSESLSVGQAKSPQDV